MPAEEILAFWFGNEADDAIVAQQKAALWWSKNSATDAEIRARFEKLVEKAAKGELTDRQITPRGRLALILLADQFPRCMYRETARAFSYDADALKWCLDGLADGVDRNLRPIERVFFYLPLEHSENLQHQERSVGLFRQLFQEVAPNQKPVFAEFLDFAVRHRDIIARFGRFPHRNQSLGRESTPEERAFLNEPGSSF
jgi:uncharacterized protein (DUF924 family)